MRVVQIAPVLAYGDAVGGDMLALDAVLRKQGYQSEVYAEIVDKRLEDRAKKINKMNRLHEDDILIYHMATASDLATFVAKQPCKRVLMYHNITPPDFFEEYNYSAAISCERGLEQVRWLKDYIDYCITVSEFNASDLRSYGYECPIDIIPIIIPFDDYKQEIDETTYNRYQDGKTNIVFTGRIAPNKKQEDLISAFAAYKRLWNPNSRLILVGKYDEKDTYYQALRTYAERMDPEDIVFTGHISFKGILACYQAAHLFLCLSEHEGFCVPVVEAMAFGKPVIAYNACAVPDTMGEGTVVIPSKEPLEVAAVMNYILTHDEERNVILKNQAARLEDFDPDKIAERFVRIIHNIENYHK